MSKPAQLSKAVDKKKEENIVFYSNDGKGKLRKSKKNGVFQLPQERPLQS